MKRSISKASLIACTLLIIGLFRPSSHAADLTVFAAASLTDALQEIAAGYKEQSGNTLVFNFAASSMLARQIEEGAPADVFFSADDAKMDELEAKGLLLKGTRKGLLSNALVIVVSTEDGPAINGPEDLATEKIKKLAIAEPSTVPAGIYAKKYLARKNLWDAVTNKVVPTENVRGALAAVESGNVDAGIVYKTDATISKKVKIAFEVPSVDSPEICYPIAALKDTKDPATTKTFLDYINSEAAIKTFAKFQFTVRK